VGAPARRAGIRPARRRGHRLSVRRLPDPGLWAGLRVRGRAVGGDAGHEVGEESLLLRDRGLRAGDLTRSCRRSSRRPGGLRRISAGTSWITAGRPRRTSSEWVTGGTTARLPGRRRPWSPLTTSTACTSSSARPGARTTSSTTRAASASRYPDRGRRRRRQPIRGFDRSV
jgi:hypothetical protein